MGADQAQAGSMQLEAGATPMFGLRVHCGEGWLRREGDDVIAVAPVSNAAWNPTATSTNA